MRLTVEFNFGKDHSKWLMNMYRCIGRATHSLMHVGVAAFKDLKSSKSILNTFGELSVTLGP